jgi:cytochrome bd ubiquinol oxidase subunit II
MDLALAWYVGLGVLLTVYAVLDGYDLGVGALHLFWRTDHERRLSLNSIGPLWDGNEVWLVTFGGALFSGFPEAYATILSALYLPFMFLLFFLIGRAVAIELRSKHESSLWRGWWDFSFAASSTLTVFTFGVFAGNLLHGIPVDERGFIHVPLLALFGPFPVLVGLLAVAGAAMHGAAFLWRKLEGEMAERARRLGLGATVVFLVLVVAVTAATLSLAPHATHNFGAAPVAWLIPVIGSMATAGALASFLRRRDTAAFASTSVTILMLCTLFGLAMFPHLLFSTHSEAASLDLWESSSSPTTLRIMSIIAMIGAPLVIVYTVIVHYVFRGKVKLGKFSY